MPQAPKILIVTGELSGDMHAAHLVMQLKKLIPDARFYALGSDNLRAVGAEILIDTLTWGSIGIFEGLKRAPRIMRAWKYLRNNIIVEQYDLIIPVDYRVLNLKVLNLCRELGIPSAYYMAPVVWPVKKQGALLFGLDGLLRKLAGGSAREKKNRYSEIAELADLVLVPFPFALEGYRKAGANHRFTGHPLSSLIKLKKTPLQVRVEQGVPARAKIVGLYPASRTHEIRHHLPTVLKAAKKIIQSGRRAWFYLSCASPQYRDAFWGELKKQGLEGQVKLVEGNDWDLMNAADLVVTKTGTICHEATFLKKPMVCFYTLHGAVLEWILKTFVIDFPFVAFPNVIAGREVVPELIQQRFSTENLVLEIEALLDDDERQQNMVEGLGEVRDACGVEHSVLKSAEAIAGLLDERNTDGSSVG